MTAAVFQVALEKAEKHRSVMPLNNIETIMGTGIRTSARNAVAAMLAMHSELEMIRDTFHAAGIWVKPRYGHYKGRPCWVEEAMLGGAGPASDIYLYIRIPSLRNKNTPIDDRHNCHVYLKDVDFVQPKTLPEGTELFIDHFTKNGRALAHTTRILVDLQEFLR